MLLQYDDPGQWIPPFEEASVENFIGEQVPGSLIMSVGLLFRLRYAVCYQVHHRTSDFLAQTIIRMQQQVCIDLVTDRHTATFQPKSSEARTRTHRWCDQASCWQSKPLTEAAGGLHADHVR
jgi:hypothetical protein